MQIMILPDSAAIGVWAAGHIMRRLADRRLRVLGVATGSSPLPVYDALALRLPRSGGRNVRADPESDKDARAEASLRSLTAFALDEYVGISPDRPESYHAVIRGEVTEKLGLDPARVHVPDGTAGDLEKACREYEQLIAEAGGVDLQILGIGATGHLGFNEPSSSFSSRTRVKTLAPQTRRDNARFFASEEQVPLHCVTQGLGTIMEASELLLVAYGEHKAPAVARAVEGPLTSMCPASIIQWHQDAVVLLDEAAASQLEHLDYYRHVQEHDLLPDQD
ncbi:glucosamine-6-phosphate deaminase [Nesterenkonia xinjiangensis]|uniref:Glucosamine-6-phosphate deaminase n=1 Tax=Nesterenkonia xinjiangensis TaxID=225327 RepID=A0A7Z0GMS3_9MICC|nr:glucosamine-6-phosphate deaminase [Nesterenkonia xinjiangensis]